MIPPARGCRGHSKPIVLQICELGRNSHKTEANAHRVAVGIERHAIFKVLRTVPGTQ